MMFGNIINQINTNSNFDFDAIFNSDLKTYELKQLKNNLNRIIELNLNNINSLENKHFDIYCYFFDLKTDFYNFSLITVKRICKKYKLDYNYFKKLLEIDF